MGDTTIRFYQPIRIELRMGIRLIRPGVEEKEAYWYAKVFWGDDDTRFQEWGASLEIQKGETDSEALDRAEKEAVATLKWSDRISYCTAVIP